MFQSSGMLDHFKNCAEVKLILLHDFQYRTSWKYRDKLWKHIETWKFQHMRATAEGDEIFPFNSSSPRLRTFL
jgi:hypothetical protein